MMPPLTSVRPGAACGFLCARSAILAILLIVGVPRLVLAEPFRDSFDHREPAWSVAAEHPSEATIQQQRTEHAGREGRGELIRIESTLEGAAVRMTCPLPAARVLDELKLTLWLRSQHPGWEVWLDIVVPTVVDPQTGGPLRFSVRGDAYTDELGRWQKLTCQTTGQAVRQKQTLLRAQQVELPDSREMYVDQVRILGRLPRGVTTVHLDDLEFGPIVPPDTVAEAPQTVAAAESNVPRVEFRLDRLLVDGRPFFPRMVPYHGEPPELLRELGFNVVWIPDVNDTRLIRRLWNQGLWVTATPPRPADETGAPLQAGAAGLLPFTADVDPVLFWMLGTRIPGERRHDLAHWIEQIEFADRRRARPMAADVAYAEQHFSRNLAMLGISRHALQSTLPLNEYRQWLQDRRSLARPGTFCWTWLQTEPAASIQDMARPLGVEAVLEPEQLRLQAYAAIAAGCRGLGFWTTRPLSGDAPSDHERRLAIRRLNLELKLLEPWLATAGSVQQIPCSVQMAAPTSSARNLPFGLDLANSLEREAQLRTRASDARMRQVLERELTAYVLRSEFGQLVIPLWLEGASQFVPAHGAVSNVSLVIPGAEQAAAVVEFSTTTLRSVQTERKAGGVRTELPMLDEVGFLWVTSDLSLIDKVRQRIGLVQADSTRVLVELATAKLDRVGLIDQELQTLGPSQPDAPQKLGRAKLRLERASSALAAADYPGGAKLSGEVLQLLRILQRDHWDAAVDHLSSPASSPFTLCFQTLPEHWRLVGQFGLSRERPSRNLLPSGEFEDFDTLVAERWENVHRAPEIVQTSAALFPTGRKSRYALRLECLPQPGIQPPLVLDEPAVTVTTPPLSARAGQILHISGWVKLMTPVSASRDGVLIYDSLLGRSGGIRIREGDQWTRFEMLRVVPQSGEVQVSMSLTGLGAALIDDLQVIPHDPRTESTTAPINPIEQTSGTRFFDRFPKLPRFTPLKSGE